MLITIKKSRETWEYSRPRGFFFHTSRIIFRNSNIQTHVLGRKPHCGINNKKTFVSSRTPKCTVYLKCTRKSKMWDKRRAKGAFDRFLNASWASCQSSERRELEELKLVPLPRAPPSRASGIGSARTSEIGHNSGVSGKDKRIVAHEWFVDDKELYS